MTTIATIEDRTLSQLVAVLRGLCTLCVNLSEAKARHAGNSPKTADIIPHKTPPSLGQPPHNIEDPGVPGISNQSSTPNYAKQTQFGTDAKSAIKWIRVSSKLFRIPQKSPKTPMRFAFFLVFSHFFARFHRQSARFCARFYPPTHSIYIHNMHPFRAQIPKILAKTPLRY